MNKQLSVLDIWWDERCLDGDVHDYEELREIFKQQIMDAYWAGIEGSMNDYSEAHTKCGLLEDVKAGGGAEFYYHKTYIHD